jgi:hypothetical protein
MLKKLNLELVDDVSQWKKWWSMRFIIIAAFLISISLSYGFIIPDDWKEAIPGWIKAILACSTMLSIGLAGVSRVIKQKNLKLEDVVPVKKDS